MGLNDFILNCVRYNKELRKDIEYYKNKNQRLQQKNEELKKQLSNDHQIKMKRLQQENRKLKQQLSNSHQIKQLKEQLKTSEKVRKKAIDKLKTLGKFDGEKCTRSFKLCTADFNELISILDIDKGE